MAVIHITTSSGKLLYKKRTASKSEAVLFTVVLYSFEKHA
ncbi:hypothetical protein JMA_05440 [Jeotgalibacillus malaysiensis]|uniref:Uncharacterized protein n=1 Tax=Jeotgalibacillus malaysiensis TaxID=1508404 RepID=A0A0B5AIJ6_9BACL|nr:hypothetical protein JMA_05440 [Jeotgalibacillus malaysiensis]